MRLSIDSPGAAMLREIFVFGVICVGAAPKTAFPVSYKKIGARPIAVPLAGGNSCAVTTSAGATPIHGCRDQEGRERKRGCEMRSRGFASPSRRNFPAETTAVGGRVLLASGCPQLAIPTYRSIPSSNRLGTLGLVGLALHRLSLAPSHSEEESWMRFLTT